MHKRQGSGVIAGALFAFYMQICYNIAMKAIKRLIETSLFAIFVCLAFSACSGIIGYSVVLWNIPEQRIADGEIVPVYLKSNISHVYVIEVPETKEKIEVPLWKLSSPLSRGKAEKLAKSYGSYEHKYAKCLLDGLPIRAESVNTAKQVYRLRQNEIIRVLAKGTGVAPTNGKANLEGEWLQVLTSNGTKGWCFSLNLKLFTMKADGSFNTGDRELATEDENLDLILNESWYPEYFGEMLTTKKINLEYMNESFFFKPGKDTGRVEISLPDTSVSFDYKGIKKVSDSNYDFTSSPVQVSVRSSSKIQVRFTDEGGKTKVRNFVSSKVVENLPGILEGVRSKKMEEFSSIKNFGPDFSSSSYGYLSFSGSLPKQHFFWSDYGLLVPSIISSENSSEGSVELKYILPASLEGSWDGILTLKFDGDKKEVNLLYKKETGGLRLCPAKVIREYNASKGIDDIIVTKSPSALVMFFKK